MGLELYQKKRRFDVTPEPRGRAARSKGDQFVIQKHAARRLHYDLRLELDGVMKSWAVTRGPSLDPGEKRLAVQVEDHPIEYNTFEGTIPAGEYGGGTVLIWDRGHWHPDGDARRALQKGNLTFTLEGTKLHGRWHLVRMHRRSGETKDNWLLIKGNDEWARTSKQPDVLEEQPLSAVSGRSMEEIAEGKGGRRVWHSNRSAKENTKENTKQSTSPKKTAKEPIVADTGNVAPARRKARNPRRNSTAAKARKGKRAEPDAPLPDFVPPSLATLRESPPTGEGWVHEIKFDGYRIQARLEAGNVRLLTRKGLDWTESFPNVAAAVAELTVGTALLDGEIVVADENGASSFSGLQAALKGGERDSFLYYVFDLLYCDGRDLRSLPLVERKAELARLLEGGAGPIRYSDHFEENGAVVLRHACDMALEGIVSKRRDAPYVSGRSEGFIKTKCANAQEFVVGGYSPSTAMPRAIGALVVGYYDKGELVYAGRIGTGYSHATARDLWKQLHALEIERPPFDRIPREEARRRDVKWVEPRTVIESQFRGWTADALVRQAAFKGVRADKSPQEVVRELARDAGASRQTEKPQRTAAARAATATKSTKAARPRSKPAAGEGKAPQADVRFTNPDRVYWVDVGVTKQHLADYYCLVWDWMAPHLLGRPLALVRCPDGTKGECFFQKHASAGLTEKYLHVVVDRNKRQVLAVEDLEGLLSLVQAGVLEVHVRGSLIGELDLCNRIVFDIDPGPGVDWTGVVSAARDVRERLAAIGLESFVKLTGGKGLHVVLPVDGTDWETTKTFAQAIAFAMTADSPDRYVAKMTKSLRAGKTFIDYLRNSLEQTSVAAYSTRARAGAPVSVPVTWEELARTKSGNQYTVLNLRRRLTSIKQDPWKDIARVKQRLPDLRSFGRHG